MTSPHEAGDARIFPPPWGISGISFRFCRLSVTFPGSHEANVSDAIRLRVISGDFIENTFMSANSGDPVTLPEAGTRQAVYGTES